MKQRLTQTGLAGIEILLVLAVLLLLGGIGSYIYTKNRPKTGSPATQSTAVVNPEGTSTSPGGIPGGANAPVPAPTTTNGSTTITIAEVGLQMSVPASLKDLTYSIQAGSITTVSFSTKALTAAIPSCAANQGTGAFDTISRGNGNYPGPANPASGGLLKQYGSYYFAYTLPNGPCAKGLSVENQNLLNKLSEDFYGSLGSVRAL